MPRRRLTAHRVRPRSRIARRAVGARPTPTVARPTPTAGRPTPTAGRRATPALAPPATPAGARREILALGRPTPTVGLQTPTAGRRATPALAPPATHEPEPRATPTRARRVTTVAPPATTGLARAMRAPGMPAAEPPLAPLQAATFRCVAADRPASGPTARFAPSIAVECTSSTACTAVPELSVRTTELEWSTRAGTAVTCSAAMFRAADAPTCPAPTFTVAALMSAFTAPTATAATAATTVTILGSSKAAGFMAGRITPGPRPSTGAGAGAGRPGMATTAPILLHIRSIHRQRSGSRITCWPPVCRLPMPLTRKLQQVEVTKERRRTLELPTISMPAMEEAELLRRPAQARLL